jgi:hypothetical protein
MPELKCNGLTVNDTNDILSGKKFHRELTPEEKEQIKDYKKSTEEFSQFFIEEAKAIQNSFALSSVADIVIKAQSFSQILAPIIENQTSFVKIFQEATSPINGLIETVENAGSAINRVHESITAAYEALSFPKSIFEAISSPTINFNNFFNDSISHFHGFSNIFNSINDSSKYFKEITDAIANIGKIFTDTVRFFQEHVTSFLEPFFLLNKSNFFLVLHASKGDAIALHKLAKLWWKLSVLYTEVEKRKGRKPTKKEFNGMVQEAC